MIMAVLNLGPLGQLEFKRRRTMPEAPEPPPPSSPEDIFPYERAPRIPTRRDASATYELRSRSDRDRSSRVTNVSQPTNNYGEPPHYSLLVPEAHTTSLKAPELPSLSLAELARTRRARARTQLFRYVNKIIALTVRADFDQLDKALNAKEGIRGSVSILSELER
jgi:hypothetical protein